MTIEDCRRFYAEEVRLVAHVTSPALVEAFARVPRERFVGPAPWRIASAEQLLASGIGVGGGFVATHDPQDLYHNVLIELDRARGLNNGQPSGLARWINALDLQTGDRVFHLGCGVGYYTAIMAEVVGSSGRVAAVEVLPELAVRAQENLAEYPHVSVHVGDGAAFDPGTCDAIFINAGVTHPHRPWLDGLARNGRMILPLTAAATAGATYGSGAVVKIVKDRGGFAAEVISVVAIYSCTSVRDSELEPQLAKAVATRMLFKLKSVRREQHEQADTCLLHGRDVCLSCVERTHPECRHISAACPFFLLSSGRLNIPANGASVGAPWNAKPFSYACARQLGRIFVGVRLRGNAAG